MTLPNYKNETVEKTDVPGGKVEEVLLETIPRKRVPVAFAAL
jgi:hypothetical protein